MLAQRPLIYVRLYRKPRAVAPPKPPPPKPVVEGPASFKNVRGGSSTAYFKPQNQSLVPKPATPMTSSSDLNAFLADQAAIYNTQNYQTSGILYGPDEEENRQEQWKRREADRFETETKQAQQEAGVALDITDRIINFRYEAGANSYDVLQITVDNYNMEEFDNPYWRKENILEISWGYPGNMAPTRRVHIKKIRGGRELMIEAHGSLALLHDKKVTRTWRNTNLLKLVEEIVSPYKGEFEVTIREYPDVLKAHDTIRQMKSSPAQAARLADLNVSNYTKRRPDFPTLAGYAAKWGQLFDVVQQMIYTIIKIESDWTINSYNPKAVSGGGAWGAMQVTHVTATDYVPRLQRSTYGGNPEVVATLKKWDGTSQSLLDPDLNVMLGVFILSFLWKRFNGNYRFVAVAYNQGSKGPLKSQKLGRPPTEFVRLSNQGEAEKYLALTETNWAAYGGVTSPTAAIVVPKPSELEEFVEAYVGTGVPPEADFRASGELTSFFEDEQRKKNTPKISSTVAESKQAFAQFFGEAVRGIDAVKAEKIKLEQVHQSAMSDAQVLSRVAEKYGFVFYVDHTGFVFEEVDAIYRQRPAKVLTWFFGDGEWLDFTYENEPGGKSKKSKEHGVDATNKETVTTEGSNEATARAGSGARLTGVDTDWKPMTGEAVRMAREEIAQLPDDDPRKAALIEAVELGGQGVGYLNKKSEDESTGPVASLNPEQAQAQTTAKHKTQSSAAHQLSGQIIGDPLFRANTMVEIKGIGRRLSGKWAVKEVTHSIGREGYTCSFKCERDGDNGYGEKGEADSLAEQQSPELKAEPKVQEWNHPTGQRLKSATDTTDPMKVRSDSEL